MSTNRDRRIVKETQELLKDPQSGIRVTASDGSTDFNDLTHFVGHFRGPPDTPYEGGQYDVDIRIPSDYPFKPPIMRFLTKIWHPNVSSQTGAICLDTLGTNWSPVLNLKSALISLQSLLSSPEPKDPQDAEVASMLITRPEEFKHKARQWAIQYANAPPPPPGSGRGGAAGSGGNTVGGASNPRKSSDKDAKKREEQRRREAYHGFHPNMIEKFTNMGFQVEQVVSAFEYVGIEKADGEEYELEEEYIGDITARLFNEM